MSTRRTPRAEFTCERLQLGKGAVLALAMTATAIGCARSGPPREDPIIGPRLDVGTADRQERDPVRRVLIAAGPRAIVGVTPEGTLILDENDTLEEIDAASGKVRGRTPFDLLTEFHPRYSEATITLDPTSKAVQAQLRVIAQCSNAHG